MERLWSFLRRFARVTKEMTPSLDLLTDGLLHYGRRKSTDMEMQLLQRLDRAEKITVLAEEDISSVIKEAPVLISERDIERWKKGKMDIAQHTVKPTSTDGQGIAIRLSKQVAKGNKRPRQAIHLYSGIEWSPQMNMYPAQITFEEACDPSCVVYSCLDGVIEEDTISRTLKRRGIDAMYMKNRAAEEKSMVLEEMKNIVEYLNQQHGSICSIINATERVGPKALLIQRQIQLERQIEQATAML
ncbi:hypothetical protein AALO_G00043950 [Alosa alosa]|uniref:Uncharacterized protein n=1 Tax=Alosa alosa TaxID=278164 RepID=A0AAV6HBR5_9TELE|nr:hypothetical protein AALO_G00043950 [Alosa alosa]